MAWSTPTSRSDGYVVPASTWNQDVVDNPIALRSGALAITSQGANTLIYGSSASQLAALAAGTQGQILQAGTSGLPTWVGPPNAISQGRLTLTTGTPVTTSDVTGAGTLYFSPYNGNQIALYNGSAWQLFAISELSIAVPAVGTQMYDAFVDYNSGTPALTLTAWTNDTTRATALTTQNGVYVLTGTLGKRYVGSVRTISASQVSDSFAFRHVWNLHHRVLRPCRVLEATNTWTYTTAAFRQANAAATNQIDVVAGLSQDAISVLVAAQSTNDNAGVSTTVAIGEDGTTPHTSCLRSTVRGPGAGDQVGHRASLQVIPAVGRHTYTWLEHSTATGTTTWYGDDGSTVMQSGITGMWHA